MSYHLVCVECGAKNDSCKYTLHCKFCGGLLDAKYEVPATVEARIIPSVSGTARYIPLLPLNNPSNLVTIGEGNTPVIPIPRVAQLLAIPNVLAKMEYFNPTASFKDRGNSIQVSVLKETGVTEVADASGGNAGHSFAAYCARAGIKFHGFINETTSNSRKVHAISLHGAEVHWVGEGSDARNQGATQYSKDMGILHMNYQQNIYFVEGLKTLAYEIYEQIDPLPDHIIIPIGNGSIYQGIWRGFKDMLEDGRASKIPRLHGVQTSETQPIVAAFEGRSWSPLPGEPKSKANGIGVRNPPRPGALLQAARESGGSFIAVSEEQTLRWQRCLAELEGIIVEPTSAVVLAAAEALKNQGVINRDDKLLVPFTGFGVKEPIPGY